MSTRENVLTAAERVVARDGLAAANVRAIATEAQVSVGTVMYHFDGGLEQLQELAMGRVMDSLYSRRLRIVARQGGVAEKLAELINLGVPDAINADLRSVYAALPQAMTSESIASRHRDLVERQVGLYLQLLEIAAEGGEISPNVPLEDIARNIVALEDANDLYPLLGLECGGGEQRRRRIRGYVETVLDLSLS